MRGQVSPHPHTWLPYITPNGVRLAREALFSHKYPSMSHKFSINLSLAQTPKGVIYGNSKNKNLWEFVAH